MAHSSPLGPNAMTSTPKSTLDSYYSATDANVLPYTKDISEDEVAALKKVFRGEVYTRKDTQLSRLLHLDCPRILSHPFHLQIPSPC